MIFPVKNLIEHQEGRLLCVRKDESLRVALIRMMESNYSQLPVVDEQGYLTGIISEQSITRAYFYANDSVKLSTLPVHHCQTSAVTISPEADVFDVLGLLRDVAAVIVVQNRKPIGLITYYDATHFFRNVSEGLMYVEDIEVMLRQYIESVFPDESKLNAALIHAFGQSKQDPSQPYRQYEKMSFYDHMQFITHPQNWSHFEAYLEPVELFRQHMDQVRNIRNQLAHFRDELSPIQLHTLIHVRDWLTSRAKPISRESKADGKTVVKDLSNYATSHKAVSHISGKYAPIYGWFSERPTSEDQLTLSFEQVEQLIGEPLPDSARNHRAWWANDSVGHAQSQAWLSAGWRVSDFDLAQGQVTFERSNGVRYQVFFSDVVAQLRKLYPTLVPDITAGPHNHLAFRTGVKGFRFGWAFTRGSSFRVELYCDTGNKLVTERVFDELQKHQGTIETKLNTTLSWERLDHRRACRIAWARPGTISASPEELEEIKQWAVKTMPLFVDTIQPYLKELQPRIQELDLE